MTTPPVPAQRGKVKLLAGLKNTQSEQSAKLQGKVQLEYDLLEDIKTYTKLRAAAEKDYAQALLKLSTQLLAKFQNKENENDEEYRTPYGLWKKILQETEATANSRMKVSHVLLSEVSENVKNLKTERSVSIKKCSALSDKLHEELTESATELSKAQKTYGDMRKLAFQANGQASDAEERLKKGSIGLFSSKSKQEKNLSKAMERKESADKRCTVARNDYLLHLAAMNAHQRKYYASDLPDLIAAQDGSIYEQFRDYYLTITNTETDALESAIERLTKLKSNINELERAYAIQLFLKENPVFTKCASFDFLPMLGDTQTSISKDCGAELPLNKEARKWATRLMKERKNIRKKSKQLEKLKSNLTLVKTTTGKSSENILEGSKATVPEDTPDSLTEEIRHLEVMLTKTEARIDAMREAGVNVDEWLQEESVEDSDSNEASESFDDNDDNDFEWDEDSASQAYSDDALSTTSSQDTRNFVTPAIVLYAFQASSQEELTVYDGEELEILESEGDGWCRTRNRNGEIGFVPEAYLEVKPRRAGTTCSDGDRISQAGSNAGSLHQEASEQLFEQQETSRQSFEEDPQQSQPAEPFVCYAKAVYDYDACEDEELSFEAGEIIWVTSKVVDDDDGWWEGILNEKKGVFPSIVVEEMQSSNNNDSSSLHLPDSRPRVNTTNYSGTFPRTNDQGNNRRIRSLEFDTSFT